ncbi:hypothetical protein, partial [Klebsiella michiganensis]|uniref:hypothetical protein n=1 Tax=Klebsiella michiganensis TaxID=1134687 RepID=UPI001BA561C3
ATGRGGPNGSGLARSVFCKFFSEREKQKVLFPVKYFVVNPGKAMEKSSWLVSNRFRLISWKEFLQRASRIG